MKKTRSWFTIFPFWPDCTIWTIELNDSTVRSWLNDLTLQSWLNWMKDFGCFISLYDLNLTVRSSSRVWTILIKRSWMKIVWSVYDFRIVENSVPGIEAFRLDCSLTQYLPMKLFLIFIYLFLQSNFHDENFITGFVTFSKSFYQWITVE